MQKAYIIMDGQWGSCGKGLIAGKLAVDRNPDVVVCNFGPNAGHTFVKDGQSIMTQQLPTGIVALKAKILLGPGSIINPKILLAELDKFKSYGVKPRLRIHENASVVVDADLVTEQALIKIGSTRKGTAAACCRKIMRANVGLPRVASECPELLNYVVTSMMYDNIIKTAKLIQIESAQGVELSLSRGRSYPTCTGRDVTPEQILNDVGVPRRLLGEVVVAIRTFPIRVGNEYDGEGKEIGNSGPVYPDMKELTWEDVGGCTGQNLLERTTVTKKVRRVFTFSHSQLRHALWVIGPCSIFLNFMNYLDKEAKSIHDSTDTTRAFLHEVNQTAGTEGGRVQWVGWGPSYEDVDDLAWVK